MARPKPMVGTVGNGNKTLFWEDRWLDGTQIQELAPVLYTCILQRAKATPTVHEAETQGTWVEDVSPNMGFAALMDYMAVWQRLEAAELDEGAMDAIAWSWEGDGQFSVRSAYAAKFAGREVVPTTDFTWRSRAPLQC